MGDQLSRSFSPNYFNQAQLEFVTLNICERFDEIQELLGFTCRFNGRYYQGPCPIHGGNPRTLTFYPFGDSTPGYWRCLSKNCEKFFRANAIGLVRGILSAKDGWANYLDKAWTFPQTVKWIVGNLKLDLSKIVFDENLAERKSFIRTVDKFAPKNTKYGSVTPEQIRSRLDCPSPYFLNRDFPAPLLEEHAIGECTRKGVKMSGRAVVPLFADGLMVGCLGRIIVFDGNTDGPPRWLDDGDIKKNLYGLDSALEKVQETSELVIVEGVADLLRLRQAGIDNSVSILGSSLTDAQSIKIEQSSSMTLKLMLDNDPAGEACAADIKKRFGKFYKIKEIKYSTKDPDQCSLEEIQECIKK